MSSKSPLLFRDLLVARTHHELWITLGWQDVISKYRRTRLGSFWVVLSMGMVAGVMGSLYSVIMGRPMEEYIPYLTAGFLVWSLLSAQLTEGAQLFVSNSVTIKETSFPPTVYALRMFWRHLSVFGHNFIVYLLVMLIFGVSPSVQIFGAIPAFLLLISNSIWIGLLFGMVNLHHRDLSHLIASAMRVLFFMTPVIWYAEMATGARSAIVAFNPFFHQIEILRGPLLSQWAQPESWLVATSITVVGWLLTARIYSRHARQIAFWV